MPRDRRAILVDARVNGFPGAHGIARSVMKLVAHFEPGNDDLALKVLVNPGRPQIFPLSELPAHAEVVSTDISLGAVHRCVELARLIRSAGAAVLYVPFPPFTPLIRPCPIVVTLHDCTQEGEAAFAGGWHRQAGLKVATSVGTSMRSRHHSAEQRQPGRYPSALPLRAIPDPCAERSRHWPIRARNCC